MSIVLVPIGRVNPAEIRWLQESLKEYFSADVVVGKRIPLAATAWNLARSQYDAEMVLESLLLSGEAAGCDRALGVTDADLYLPGMNFVFGIANRGIAIISQHRLRQSFYNLPEDPGIFRRRAVVEAVHELGHTFGLAHCENPRCAMHFSNTIADTDRKGPEFCPVCRSRVATVRNSARPDRAGAPRCGVGGEGPTEGNEMARFSRKPE